MAAFSTIASIVGTVIGAATSFMGGGGKGGGGGGGQQQQGGAQVPQTDPAAEAAKRRAAGTETDLTSGGPDLGDPNLKKPKLGNSDPAQQARGDRPGGLLG